MYLNQADVGKPLSSADKDFFKYTTVHELGHAWDFSSHGSASRDMENATHSWYLCWVWYIAGGVTTKYGQTNHAEDWAEAVANYVYSPGRIDAQRIAYVKQRMQNP